MRYSVFSFIAAVAVFAALPASAQKLEETFKDWKVITVEQEGKQVCYLHATPAKKSGSMSNRGEPYLLITSRGPKTDEVSISAGYPYKAKSEAVVKVDGKEFNIFTKDELAWAYNEKQDSEIVAAIKKGKQLVVSAQDQQGGSSQDTYALSGVSAAYKKMKELCK